MTEVAVAVAVAVRRKVAVPVVVAVVISFILNYNRYATATKKILPLLLKYSGYLHILQYLAVFAFNNA